MNYFTSVLGSSSKYGFQAPVPFPSQNGWLSPRRLVGPGRLVASGSVQRGTVWEWDPKRGRVGQDVGQYQWGCFLAPNKILQVWFSRVFSGIHGCVCWKVSNYWRYIRFFTEPWGRVLPRPKRLFGIVDWKWITQSRQRGFLIIFFMMGDDWVAGGHGCFAISNWRLVTAQEVFFISVCL